MSLIDINGTKLNELTVRLSIKQGEIAAACEVTPNTIWNWFSEKNDLRRKNAFKLANFLHERGASSTQLEAIGLPLVAPPKAPLPAKEGKAPSIDGQSLEGLVQHYETIEQRVLSGLFEAFDGYIRAAGGTIEGTTIHRGGQIYSFSLNVIGRELQIHVVPLYTESRSVSFAKEDTPSSLGRIRHVVCVGPGWLDRSKIAVRLGTEADRAYAEVAKAIRDQLWAPSQATKAIREVIDSTAEDLCVAAVAPTIRLIAFDGSSGVHLLDERSFDFALETFRRVQTGFFSPLQLLCALLTESLPRDLSLSRDSLSLAEPLIQPFQGAKFQENAKTHWIATRALLDHTDYGVYPLGKNLNQTLTASYPADREGEAVSVLNKARLDIRNLFTHHMKSFSSWVALPARALKSPSLPMAPGDLLSS